MDKRSLLFTLLLFASFFGVQTWFDYQRNEERKIKIALEQKNQESRRLQEIATRTARFEDLPITSLFADPEGKLCVGSAAALGKVFVTIGDIQLPSTLYVREEGKMVTLEAASSLQSQEPILYKVKGSSLSSIEVPEISLEPTDLQLVALNDPQKVVVGEWKEGRIALPFDRVEGISIAFMKDNQRYVPVGVFDPEAKKVKALHEFQKLHVVAQPKPAAVAPEVSGQEEFYVLENEYQQLVFSNKGGALAEINLPQKTKENPKSIIREIDVDREILAQSPQNAYFPSRPYYRIGDTGAKELVQTRTLGGYYPLLRRPIFDRQGIQISSVPSEYYALAVIGDDPMIANLVYRVTRFEKNLIQFEAKSGSRKITKTFSLPKEKNGPYCFDVTVQIDGNNFGLWLSSGVPDVEILANSYAPLLRLQFTKNGSSDVETIDLPKKDTLIFPDMRPNWLSNCNGFLGLIQQPLQKLEAGYRAAQVDGAILPTRLSLIDASYHLYPAANYPGYMTALPLSNRTETSFRVFAGPYDEKLLKELDELYEDPKTHYNPEFSSAQKIQGWFSFISEPFVKFLSFLMHIFYAITRSWAASIILLTVALRAMMYPLNSWSIRSAMRMQELAPKLRALQEKYKNDPKRAQMETVNLYRSSGANPLVGCLPMLLQLPFLTGMFYLLKSSFSLRGAPFIPGWIDDLSAPDVIWSWGQPLWIIGNELHLLPFLMGFSMYLQQKMTSQAPKDPSRLTDTEKQQKMMGTIFPVVLVLMFYGFPSGLNLYFMFSTLLGIAQQWWMTRKMQTPQ